MVKFICASCCREFETREKMQEHWKQVGIPVPKTIEWKCPRCNGIFDDDTVVKATRYGDLRYKPKTPLCPRCYMTTLTKVEQ